METNRFSYRSLFLPVLLIGVGALWLLGNLGVIQPVNLLSLLRLWPLLLVALGLDLLFGRRSPVVGSLIALALLAFVIIFLVAGPNLGWVRTPNVTHDVFKEPLNGATSAEYDFDLSAFPVNIGALEGGSDLVVAEINHMGNVRFGADGGASRNVSIRSEATNGFNMFDLLTSTESMKWSINVSPDVPAEMSVNSGSGWVDVRLTDLNLVRLNLDSGSGAVTLHMPEMDGYEAYLNSGSGAVNANVPCQTGEIHVDSGSGAVRINVVPDCPVQVEVRSSGSGAVSIASSYKKISGRMEGKEGVWQSPQFTNESDALLIIADDLGSGSFNVR